MRFTVEAVPGIVASDPEGAVLALADIAEADGADRADWLEKAGHAASTIPVAGEPRYRVVRDAVARADTVFRTAMAAMMKELNELLLETS